MKKCTEINNQIYIKKEQINEQFYNKGNPNKRFSNN